MMTWYGYRTAIDEAVILGNLRIIADLFSGYPQQLRIVMLLDHGWEEDANWGFWKPDAQRFPGGMPALAREAKKLGIDLGLWYTPFCITENAPNLADLLPLRAVDEAGKPYTGLARVWGDLPNHSSESWPLTYFDGGRTEVQEKWHRELGEMRAWGTWYWKLDFFSLMTSAKMRRRLGEGELYARTWRTFREAAGETAHLAPCSCRTNIQLGYNDSVRVATDIGNAGHWPGAMKEYRHGMATIAALWYKNRRFWVNDADSIQVGKGCALSEARVRATVVALSGGHFMLSEDLRTVDEERIEMIRRLLPPYPEAARPIDLFENPFPEGYPCLWSLSLSTGFGPLTVLAVFNLGDRTRTWTITPGMVGIEEGKEFLALEWWQCRWLGRFSGPFAIEVPAEDVAVIHARPCGSTPSLVSVSHHITGGWIIEEASFDERTGMLSGTIATRRGLRIVLFGHLPTGWSFSREANFHGSISSTGGWQSELTTTSQRTRFEIGFRRRP
jgi:alpha-galactosidase